MSCGEAGDGLDGQKKAEAIMPKQRKVRRVEKGICQRCREAKSAFVIRSGAYCRTCFEQNVFSRFTRALYPPLHPGDPSTRHGGHTLYRPPRLHSNVAIAVSGGAGSMCMMDMLVRGGFVGTGDDVKAADKTKGEKDVIWDKGYVVYVEFAGVVEQGEDRTAWIKEIVASRGLDFVGLRAEDVFDGELSKRLGGVDPTTNLRAPITVDLKDAALPLSSHASSSLTPLEKLQKLVTSVPSPSRPALLSNILHSLLQTASTCLSNTTHLLLGETSTRQAQRVISGTASGRGWALPLELGVSLPLPGNILRVSPMKDLGLKETAFSCKLQGVEMRNFRDWGKAGGEGKRDARGKGGAMSIEGLTEQFIAGLDVTHPATVSTITRTGGKLVFPGGSDRDTLCPLCQMPVDPSALAWKARTALTQLPKTPGAAMTVSDVDASRSQLASSLCYACLTTLTPTLHRNQPLFDPVELPVWVASRAPVEREQMRAEIGDFLLDQED